MKRNWDDIKWIFDVDGTLRDIYVQEVSISDWEKLIDLLNEKYTIKYGTKDEEKNPNQIDKEYAIKFLTDETGEMEIRSISIDIGEIQINCHLFLPDQIEFDINPKQINSIEEFEKVKNFMEMVSQTLDNQVTLTSESSPEFPLVKIDTVNGICKILTEYEAKELWENSNSFKERIISLKTKLKMRFFPKTFNKHLLKSAGATYKSITKNKNVW